MNRRNQESRENLEQHKKHFDRLAKIFLENAEVRARARDFVIGLHKQPKHKRRAQMKSQALQTSDSAVRDMEISNKRHSVTKKDYERLERYVKSTVSNAMLTIFREEMKKFEEIKLELN